MMIQMKRRLIAFVITASFVLLQPVVSLAAEEPTMYDARLEGFYNGAAASNAGAYTLPASGTSLVWIAMLVMTGVCVGVLFKDAGRTHLD